MNSLKKFLLAGFVVLLVLVLPVMASLNTIQPGGTAFIGEQGLDITQTGVKSGSTIAWYSGSANVGTSAPTATVTVDDPSAFYIAPVSFAGKTGAWYIFPTKTLAFYVQDPSLDIRIFDYSSDFEVTGTVTWVPKGDSVSFGIDNNLYVMANRPGVTGAPVTIHIRSPDGAEYTQVSGNSLVNIPVSSAAYTTGPVWSTGSFQSGTYTVWAECNANGMNDNYNTVGKSRSTDKPMLLQSVNPLITSSLTPAMPVGTLTIPVIPPAVTTLPTSLPTPTPTTTTSLPVTTGKTPPPSMSPATLTPPVTASPTTTPGPGLLLVSSGIAVAFLLSRRPGIR
jgi:Domain of unknown function (DUF3821)